MATSHKYYDRQISSLQKKLYYLKRDIQSIQERVASDFWCDELNRTISMGELVRMIQALEDRFPDIERD